MANTNTARGETDVDNVKTEMAETEFQDMKGESHVSQERVLAETSPRSCQATPLVLDKFRLTWQFTGRCRWLQGIS